MDSHTTQEKTAFSCALTLTLSAFIALASHAFSPRAVACKPRETRVAIEKCYMEAKDHVKNGEAQLAASDFSAAMQSFRSAIAALGDSYRSNGVIDDTGTNVTLASLEEKNGRLSVAANLLKGVANARLRMYETGHGKAQ